MFRSSELHRKVFSPICEIRLDQVVSDIPPVASSYADSFGFIFMSEMKVDGMWFVVLVALKNCTLKKFNSSNISLETMFLQWLLCNTEIFPVNTVHSEICRSQSHILKYLSNCWLACHEILYKHPQPPVNPRVFDDPLTFPLALPAAQSLVKHSSIY